MPPTIWHNENMKYRVAIIASLLLACAASPPVQAQPGGRDPAWRAERQPQRDAQRDDEMQRRQQERMSGEQGRRGRLSPEEREQLRRDIRQHGRDVYRDRSRRF
ncbi:MAG: hypothetical protein MOGDAGHF_00228 [Rhodocyclaceae bacterium]|jgi:outer membrane biogenesis lipoprotein LolB|nr:hypothetical protein [Rhodocyclaceae bacterium]